jgi:hypothetical protein
MKDLNTEDMVSQVVSIVAIVCLFWVILLLASLATGAGGLSQLQAKVFLVFFIAFIIDFEHRHVPEVFGVAFLEKSKAFHIHEARVVEAF